MNEYRRFGPKTQDHPSVGEICPVCKKPFKEGDYTTLETLPPEDPEEIRKMIAGRAYTTPAVEVHWDCKGQHST